MTNGECVNCYLVRRLDGRYFLTGWPPILCEVGTTGVKDAFAQIRVVKGRVIADPFLMPTFCHYAARVIFPGRELQPLEYCQVELRGERVSALTRLTDETARAWQVQLDTTQHETGE